MDYEKAYKEALERAKKNYDTAQDLCEGSQIGVECFKNTLTNIFPELKESEDEKIRKGLIKGLSAMRDIHHHQTFSDDAININEALSWLEKQANKDKLIKELGEYKVKYTQEVLEKHINSMNNKDDEQYLLVCKNALAKYQTTDKWDAYIISNWLENKLKSIKERTTWKPSDNELEVLRLAAEKDGTCLMGLYQKLKKLREE